MPHIEQLCNIIARLHNAGLSKFLEPRDVVRARQSSSHFMQLKPVPVVLKLNFTHDATSSDGFRSFNSWKELLQRYVQVFSSKENDQRNHVYIDYVIGLGLPVLLPLHFKEHTEAIYTDHIASGFQAALRLIELFPELSTIELWMIEPQVLGLPPRTRPWPEENWSPYLREWAQIFRKLMLTPKLRHLHLRGIRISDFELNVIGMGLQGWFANPPYSVSINLQSFQLSEVSLHCSSTVMDSFCKGLHCPRIVHEFTIEDGPID